MKKIKCEKCSQTLLFAAVIDGEIKCPRCGKINKIIYPRRQEHIKRTV